MPHSSYLFAQFVIQHLQHFANKFYIKMQTTRTNQTDMDLHYEDPLSLSYVMVLDTEVMLAEQLEGFFEEPTACTNSIVHLNNLATADWSKDCTPTSNRSSLRACEPATHHC